MKTSIVSFLNLSRLAITAAVVFAAVASVVKAESAKPVRQLSYAASWGQVENTATSLAGFSSWASKYTAEADPVARRALVAEGVALAKSRNAALAHLIEADPERAIALAVPTSVRTQMPAEIAGLMETRVSGTGDLSVLVFDPDRFGHGPSKTVRTVTVGGKKYEAYVYGRRAYQGTKLGIPVHGIAIGNKLALHESPVRQAEAVEAPAPEQIKADLRNSSEKTGSTLVEVAGKYYVTASVEKAVELESRLIAAEAGLTPHPVTPAASVLTGAAIGTGGGAETSPDPTTPWTIGAKQIIVIRVDFSDDPGEPHDAPGFTTLNNFITTYTADYVHNFTDQHIDPYYRRSSFGLTSISNVVTAVYRMPRTKADYGATQDNDGLHTDAETAASADYDLSKFDRIVVLFNFNIDLGYGGLAQIHGRRVWSNGEYDFRVIAHELGHTWGLYHANLWTVDDGDPISPNGFSQEYGDDFDTMGANYADTEETDFNMWKKNLLGWISDSQVLTPGISTTNRIYYFDNQKATGPMAVKVAKNDDGAGHSYWIGYHPRFAENPNMSNGAYILWGYDFNWVSELLDMNTPGSSPDSNSNSDIDAGLLAGSIFADRGANFAIQPIKTGSDATGKYLDVAINLPPAPPQLLKQPANMTAADGMTAMFVVAGDGVPAPAYQWQRQASGSSTWVSLTDNGIYSGTKSDTLLVYPAKVSMSGDLFRCNAANNVGTTTSGTAKLTVISNDVETVIGLGGFAGSVDGAGSLARFNEPYGIAVGADGNIYVADTYNFTIRKITAQGVASVMAGKAGAPGSTNGSASESRFGYPKGVAVGPDGGVYVADTGNHTIRRIGTDGLVNTLGGLAGNSGSVDGVGTRARFNFPQALAADAAGDVYVADTFNHTIRVILPSGEVKTLAGSAGKAGSADGTGTKTAFNLPAGLAFDGTNSLYVADSGNHAIRIVNTKTGAVTTYAGRKGQKGNSNGPATNSTFNGPLGVALDSSGNVFVADTQNDALRLITPDGTVSTYTGQAGVTGTQDGTLATALFSAPASIATDRSGNIYVADRRNETVRLVTRAGRSGPPPLALTVAKINGRIVLTWPTSASGFVLERTASLSPASWVAQTTGITTVGNTFVVTNNPTGTGGYFRLRNPQ